MSLPAGFFCGEGVREAWKRVWPWWWPWWGPCAWLVPLRRGGGGSGDVAEEDLAVVEGVGTREPAKAAPTMASARDSPVRCGSIFLKDSRL